MHPHDTAVPEEWRPIPGLEGYYSASNLGRIRRDKRWQNSSPDGVLRTPAGPKYPRVHLTLNHRHVYALVHQLVASTFIGPCPEGLEVNHKDGNKFNNTVGNLEYVTRLRNRQHASEIGLNPSGDQCWQRHSPGKLKRGEACSWTVLTDQQVEEIRKAYIPRVVTQAMLAQRYGVSDTHICNILKGKRRTPQAHE